MKTLLKKLKEKYNNYYTLPLEMQIPQYHDLRVINIINEILEEEDKK